MMFAKLLTTLSDRGLSVYRAEDDRLKVQGDQSRLTPEMCEALRQHRAEFLKLLPSNAERCEQIVSDAIEAANSLSRASWIPSDLQWEVMDAAQDKMHDAARQADVEATRDAADTYVRVVADCSQADALHDWGPSMSEVHTCGGRPERFADVERCDRCGWDRERAAARAAARLEARE